nr:MAG TPA: hypothetical protein [Caudoviricetes sp.]
MHIKSFAERKATKLFLIRERQCCLFLFLVKTDSAIDFCHNKTYNYVMTK